MLGYTLEELLGTDGVAIVEWPERLGPYTPRRAVRVRLQDLGGDEREIKVEEEPGEPAQGGRGGYSIR